MKVRVIKTPTEQFKDGGKWIQNAVNPSHKGYCTPMSKSTCTPRRKALARTFKKHHGFHQNGGVSGPMNPQLLEAYSTITSQLEKGADPDSIVGEFVSQGMSYDDAQHLVNQMQFPKAQMGGAAQPGMNAGMFAGQSQQPFIIKKPLMKEGGQTFVTSQQAYTAKSHNYFGTSNAPARDSYVDNDQVTTSVKPVPEEDATIEAEKGEYILSNKGLYKILGKKHSEGGTPLAAKGGEFIFSAHKDMSLDPNLQKEAGLKVHSSKALAEHTPAKVLERNIDTKEYNRLKSILENPKSDPVTKKTAQFMLDKMDTKLQTISKLQEAKKQPAQVEVQDQYLEQGDIQGDINEQKQYAYGGNALPKYQIEGTVTGTTAVNGTNIGVDTPAQYKYSAQNTGGKPGLYRARGTEAPEKIFDIYTGGDKTPTGESADFQGGFDALNTYINDIQKQGVDFSNFKTAGDFQKGYYNNLLEKNPTALTNMWTKYGINKKGLADPLLKGKLEALGVKTTVNPTGGYKMNFEGLAPDKLKESLSLLSNPYADNNIGARTLYNETPPPVKTLCPEGQPIDPVTGKCPEPEKGGGGDDGTIPEPIPGNIGIQDPYNKIRGMQGAQYLNNLYSNKRYFTYAAPINQPLTEFQKMSRQPVENQGAAARYSQNQLASKFGDRTASQVAAAGQQNDIYNNLYRVEEFNTQGENQNYNNNLLRNSAAVNSFNKDLKQTADLNNNVNDKWNYANAAYTNQYSTARQKDMLNKYYADVDLQTSMLPYLDENRQMPIDLRTKGMNPNWRGWNTNAVNTMANRQNDFDTKISQYQKLKQALGGREPTEKEIQYFSGNNNK